MTSEGVSVYEPTKGFGKAGEAQLKQILADVVAKQKAEVAKASQPKREIVVPPEALALPRVSAEELTTALQKLTLPKRIATRAQNLTNFLRLYELLDDDELYLKPLGAWAFYTANTIEEFRTVLQRKRTLGFGPTYFGFLKQAITQIVAEKNNLSQ